MVCMKNMKKRYEYGVSVICGWVLYECCTVVLG